MADDPIHITDGESHCRVPDGKGGSTSIPIIEISLSGALLRLMQERQPRTVLELAEWSGRAASNLSRTLRHLERHGLVKMHRSPDTRAVRPEALATEFLIVLD